MSGWSLLKWFDTTSGVSGPPQDVGTQAPLPVQISQPVPVSVTETPPVGLTKAGSIAYEASRVFRTNPCTLYSITVYSSLASAQWIQIFDTTALPPDTAVPEFIFNAPTVATTVIDFGLFGYPLRNGLVVCNSTTGPTKTIGAANCWFNVRLK